MKSLLFASVCLALAACGRPEPGPEPIDAVPVREISLQGYWKHFGVSGSDFMKESGTAVGGEGSLVGFKTLDGELWYIHFAPNDDVQISLHSRALYMVHVSGDRSKGCGSLLRNHQAPPAKCIDEERVVSWDEAKTFLKEKVGFTDLGEDYSSLEALEAFLGRQ